MNQIMVVYWSQTGNTEAMANAVAEGIRKAGKDALVTEVSNISADALKDAGVFAWDARLWEQKSWKRVRWIRLWQRWRRLLPVSILVSLAPYGWVMESGCATGRPVWPMQERRSGRRRRHCQESPGEDALNHCREAGRALAAAEV